MLARREVVVVEEDMARLEPRVAKLEADVAYIGSRVSNIEIDLREMRKSTEDGFDATKAEFKEIRAEMSAEFKGLRAEMSAEFKAVRAEMCAEFKAVRGEISAGFDKLGEEFRAGRTEAKEGLNGVRVKLDRLWDRVTTLQLMVVILTIGGVLVTKGSQVYQTIWQWLTHLV